MTISLGVIDLPPFPQGVFPDAIEKFVGELSRSTEAPHGLAGLTILAALATASHNKYVVQVKSDYCELMNLWTAVARPPGSRKSAVLAAPIKSIEKYERQKHMKSGSVIPELLKYKWMREVPLHL